jgi:two-component system chemotaxis sensor kinase CheA
MDYNELFSDYLDDAGNHLNAFDAGLLSLEKNGWSGSVIQNMLGALHTLKGNSGMMGFDALKGYIHKVEELLKKVLDNETELDRVMEILFDSANVIRNTLQEIGNEEGVHSDLTDKTLGIEKFLEGAATGPQKQEVELSSYLGARTDTIKVDFKRLDDLLNLVGELVIYKTRLNQIETQVRGMVNEKSVSKELKDGLELMGKTISGLQEGIMRARMLPVISVFGKFPRMVRDLAKAQGKEIQLLFEGEETELDKTVIDELEEPLLHILRNAVDHGIETPEARVKSGKYGNGKIILSAAHESNNVIIQVRDDGRGINVERVREKGIERKLIKPEDALDRETVLSLIFSPGFTTKEEATDLSGRGIGLDVVSRNIAKLNGQVIVESTPGAGTTFTIRLPLSLAIIPALMAEAAGEVYAIPMSAVEESIKVREDEIHLINNREVIRFREQVMPVIRLHDFFGLGGKRKKRFYLVILSGADRSIAVAVDKLRGQQEIVIKPLDETFGKSYGVAGASILGDGRIVLIIDVAAVRNGRRHQKTV